RPNEITPRQIYRKVAFPPPDNDCTESTEFLNFADARTSNKHPFSSNKAAQAFWLHREPATTRCYRFCALVWLDPTQTYSSLHPQRKIVLFPFAAKFFLREGLPGRPYSWHFVYEASSHC